MTATSDDHDELVGAVAGMTEAIKGLRDEVAAAQVYGRKNRHLIRIVAVSVVFDIGLSVGMFYGINKANDASNKARKASSTAVVSCTAANTSNDIQKKLWTILFAFPAPVNETAEAKAQREQQTAQFKTYIDTAFAPHDCSKVGG